MTAHVCLSTPVEHHGVSRQDISSTHSHQDVEVNALEQEEEEEEMVVVEIGGGLGDEFDQERDENRAAGMRQGCLFVNLYVC